MNALRHLRLAGFGIAALVFAVDRALKAWVAGPLALRERAMIELTPFFNLTWAENRGVSLGLLTADTHVGRWLLVAMTAAIAAGVVVWLLREKAGAEIAALGRVLGGALGNIHDRVQYGYVVDFLDLHFGDFRPFMIFNVADAAITIGVLIILARSLLSREKRPQSGARAPSES